MRRYFLGTTGPLVTKLNVLLEQVDSKAHHEKYDHLLWGLVMHDTAAILLR